MPDKMRELLPSCSFVSRNCINNINKNSELTTAFQSVTTLFQWQSSEMMYYIIITQYSAFLLMMTGTNSH